jgi:hypothetical protein
VQIERLDPATDTSAVRACHEIHLAEWRADGVRRAPLSPRVFRAWLGFEVLERQLSWELETARAPEGAGLAAPGASAAQS